MSSDVSCSVEWNVVFGFDSLVAFWERATNVFRDTFSTFKDFADAPQLRFSDPAELARRNLEVLEVFSDAPGSKFSEPVVFLGSPFETMNCCVFISQTPRGNLHMELSRAYRTCGQRFYELSNSPLHRFKAFDLVEASNGQRMATRFKVFAPGTVDAEEITLKVQPDGDEYAWPLVGRIVRGQFDLICGVFEVLSSSVDRPIKQPDFVNMR